MWGPQDSKDGENFWAIYRSSQVGLQTNKHNWVVPHCRDFLTKVVEELRTLTFHIQCWTSLYDTTRGIHRFHHSGSFISSPLCHASYWFKAPAFSLFYLFLGGNLTPGVWRETCLTTIHSCTELDMSDSKVQESLDRSTRIPGCKLR